MISSIFAGRFRNDGTAVSPGVVHRWLRFVFVGCIGFGVQLGVLAVLHSFDHGHYLLASAAALEVTLLHNFVWHVHYTWRDRSSISVLGKRLLRVHMANGLVSLVGNLWLTGLLVHRGRLPLVAANAIAILGCSVLNFALAHLWAFAAQMPAAASERPDQTAASGR